MNLHIYICLSSVFALILVHDTEGGPTASKAALHSSGVRRVCDLTGELKGVGKYVADKLLTAVRPLNEMEQVRKGLAILRTKPEGDRVVLAVLENYIATKSGRFYTGFQTIIKPGVEAAVAATYAGARVDEFFYALAGMHTTANVNGNTVASCFVDGQADTQWSSPALTNILQNSGESNQHVKKCFLPPHHDEIKNTDGLLHFETHLSGASTGDAFLTTNAVTSTAGCPLLTVGSNKLVDTSYGPGTWQVAGGLIKFDATGSTLANSKILTQAEALEGPTPAAVFKKANDQLNEFKNDKLQKFNQLTDSAFKEQSLEELEKNTDFKTALYQAGIISDREAQLSEPHLLLYEKCRSEYAEARKITAADTDGSQYDEALRKLAKSISTEKQKNSSEKQPTSTPNGNHAEQSVPAKPPSSTESASVARQIHLKLLSAVGTLSLL